DMTKKDEYGTDALMAAVYTGDPGITGLLMENGADVSGRDGYGYSPLLYAAETGDTSVVRLLLDFGARVNDRTNNGLTALAVAVKNRNTDVAAMLIKAGANVNLGVTGIKRKITPMTFAVQNRDKESKKLLMANGARRDLLPCFGRFSAGYGLDWNFTDFMYDVNLGINDVRYNMGLSCGYAFRLGRNRVLFPVSGSLYYQYWEWRSFFYLDFEKRFRIYSWGDKNTGLLIGCKELYTFGKYRATKKKPFRGLVFAPKAGLYYSGKNGCIRLMYEYADFGIYRTSPHRINIGVNLLINIDNYSAGHKTGDWLRE
ncbi:MAG: ankyrin repeat domain-containing protein, partial [Bacteroidetes bacterium]|nr:ankyrin repeat domain-containing protein [Bacteroidota bacterium]